MIVGAPVRIYENFMIIFVPMDTVGIKKEEERVTNTIIFRNLINKECFLSFRTLALTEWSVKLLNFRTAMRVLRILTRHSWSAFHLLYEFTCL
jgi:hypothetical protein